MSRRAFNTGLHFPRKQDDGHYLFSFADEYETLFEVHADTLEGAEAKLVEILNLAPEDSRRSTHWQDWPPAQPGDAFKYGRFRKVMISPRKDPSPTTRKVQK